jgi:hypothetical protein
MNKDTTVELLLSKLKHSQDFARYKYPPDMVKIYEDEGFMVISELRPTIKDVSLDKKHL